MEAIKSIAPGVNDSSAASELATTPVKRGRGRPRKYPRQEELVETEVKRGRGRPRKYPRPEGQLEDGIKRGRGRPRKVFEMPEPGVAMPHIVFIGDKPVCALLSDENDAWSIIRRVANVLKDAGMAHKVMEYKNRALAARFVDLVSISLEFVEDSSVKNKAFETVERGEEAPELRAAG